MALKDLLVHVTDTPDSDARVAAAIALAGAHDAHLVGLYTLWIPPMPAYVQNQVGAELVARQRALYVERMRSAEASFAAATSRAGVNSEWRCTETHRDTAMTTNAHYCDLVIMGKHHEAFGENNLNLVENVVLTSGKPVLVLPDEGAPRGLGKHVMAAWNGSREAVRAIDAALPLLEAAQRVDVIAVDPREETHGAVPAADLSAHLARHGVRVEAQAVHSGDNGVGETLLARAAADGVDLLVLGAYGHARWREVVLGGATAHVLRHARLPLLMAH